MDTREDHDIEVRHGPDVMAPAMRADAPDGAPDGPLPTPPRRRLVVALVGMLVLAIVATLALVLVLGDDDEQTVKATTPPADAAAGPAALGLTVQLPETVVAGEEATIVVRWSDGEGLFSGSTEEWGDDVGASSIAQDTCTGVTTDQPAAGRYAVSHTWAEPGTYQVVLGVATYTCESGTAVTEEASKTVSVEVVAAG